MKSLKTLKENPYMLFVYVVISLALVLNIFVAGYWYGRTKEFSQRSSASLVQAQTSVHR